MSEVIRYVSHDGLNLFAYGYGPKDASLTVLCIHGLTRNHKDFEPMIACLNPAYRFIAVDVRGRGESEYDRNPYNYIPPVYARDMVTLLDDLGIEKVALIGTSMGGLISIAMMKMIPERILGVVLNDIGPAVIKAGITRITNYVGKSLPFPDWETAINSIKEYNQIAFPNYAEADWLAFAKRICRELKNGEVIFDYDPKIYKAFRINRVSFMSTMLAWQMFEAMAAAPLLLIRGALSDLLTAQTAEKMVAVHGSASLVTVEEVGHAPLLNEPIVVNALNAFLSKLEAK